MRAYFIRITHPVTGAVLKFYTSFNTDGSTNGSALRVELDIPVFSYERPAGNARVKVYGVSYADIQGQSDLNNADITIYGGMAKGLPLANPQQAGILFQGTVFQCFANAQGRETSLELFLIAKPPTANLSFTWGKGASLESAVRQVLSIGYPNSTITGGFDPAQVYTEDQPFSYQNLQQLGKFVYDTSKAINPSATYIGARITQNPKGFYLFDGTVRPAAKAISFLDLIGNATWLEFQVMQFMAVMRADLVAGDKITMPQGTNQINSASSFATFRNRAAFQGEFLIRGLRHVGDSRQLSAEAWVTVVDCMPVDAT